MTLGGVELTQHPSRDAFNAADAGWFNDSTGKTIGVKSGVKQIASAKEFVVGLAQPFRPAPVSITPSPCPARATAGIRPIPSGRWPARAIRSQRAKSGSAANRSKFTANGNWQRNWGVNGQQNGPNFPPLSVRGLYEVTFDEDRPAQPVLTPLDTSPGLCGSAGVTTEFICENGQTVWGASVYVVGNIAELANWNTDKAIKLEPNGPYPTWKGTIGQLPASARIEWKCIKRLETGNPPPVMQWEPGDNNAFTTPAAGKTEPQKGAFLATVQETRIECGNHPEPRSRVRGSV